MPLTAPGYATYAPPVTPIRGGLLDHATVQDVGSLWLDETEGAYQDLGCGNFTWNSDICTPGPDKSMEGVAWPTGNTGYAYYAIECKMLGFDMDAAERDLASIFAAGETVPVEGLFAESAFVTGSVAVGGAATGLSAAIGALENYAANNYVGQSLLHVPRSLVATLCEKRIVSWGPDGLTTCLGTPVVAGAGYAGVKGPGTDAAATEAWLHITGPVVVYRTKINVIRGYTLAQNVVRMLGERAYHIVTPCLRASAKATR